MKAVLVVAAMLALAGCMSRGTPAFPGAQPSAGFVPDDKTAIAIAVAVWSPIFGSKTIAREKPYHAELKEGVWHVFGSIPSNEQGGTAEVLIAQRDGKILSVFHSQ
jgi:hypothetical protein